MNWTNNIEILNTPPESRQDVRSLSIWGAYPDVYKIANI